MTAAEAQRLQDEAQARGRWLMWLVAVSAGKARAWALMADPQGGVRVPGELAADTLEELRAMLPPGLSRWGRRSVARGAPVMTVGSAAIRHRLSVPLIEPPLSPASPETSPWLRYRRAAVIDRRRGSAWHGVRREAVAFRKPSDQ